MRLMVTGGAGFIGSAICRKAVKMGHDVLAVDDLSTGQLYRVAGVCDTRVIDIRSKVQLAVALRDFKPEVVLHHAAQVSVTRSVEDAADDASRNILGTINVVELCNDSGVKGLIYATSGGAMYGNTRSYPTKESATPKPASPYALSKLTGERYVQLCAKIPWVALRYSNVYGPGQDGSAESGVCAIFTQRMLQKLPCTIYGDGSATRDYVFVEDIARANMACLKPGNHWFRSINVGSGLETSTLEVFSKLKSLTGYARDPEHQPARPGELQRSCLNTEMAQKFLQWYPGFNFDQGLAATVEHYRKHPHPEWVDQLGGF